jgi:hypothetical protein
MSESLTYGSVGGPVGQPLALPGTASRPRCDSAKAERSRLGSSRCAGALAHQRENDSLKRNNLWELAFPQQQVAVS